MKNNGIECYDEGEFRVYTGKAEVDKAFHLLVGIVNGIEIDGKVNEHEIEELLNWIYLHNDLEKYKPFNELIPMVREALVDGRLDPEEIQDIKWVCDKFTAESEYYNLTTHSIQELQGVLHGIMADGEITDEEIHQLQRWINDNDILKGTYPYAEIESILCGILSDGIITEKERHQLMAFVSDFIDCSKSVNVSKIDIEKLQSKYKIAGLCCIDPDIEFDSKIFCFTGKSTKATREEICVIVENHNGIFNNNVLKDTHYLIIGNEGSPCWAFSCYGRKVEKAVDLRKKGAAIQIINELDFWDAF